MRPQYTIYGLFLVLFLAGCAEEQGPAPTQAREQVTMGLDETAECPDGEVGWRFPATPLRKDTESYALRKGDDLYAESPTPDKPSSIVVDIFEKFAVQVQSATCGTAEAEELRRLKGTCDNDLTCIYPVQCAEALTVTYTCGVTDTDATGEQKTYTASSPAGAAGREVMVACRQPAEEQVKQTTRVECIPRECHGRSRRDLNMKCVLDPTINEMAVTANGYTINNDGYVSTYAGFIINTGNALQSARNKALIEKDPKYAGKVLLYPDTDYRIQFALNFKFKSFPPNSTFVGWLDDLYTHKTTGETVQAFRCEAFRKDILTLATSNTADGTVYLSYDGSLSEACVGGGRVSEDTAAKKLGVSVEAFRRDYVLSSSFLHGSYDLEGRGALHKNLPRGDTPQTFAYSTPECAPNPPEFFYDSATNIYDLRAYYAQREIIGSSAVTVVPTDFQRQAVIVPGEVTPRANLTLRLNSRLNASLPVDINWTVLNMNAQHRLNPWAKGVAHGGAFDGASYPGANWAPVKMRADIYLRPLRTPNSSLPVDQFELFDYKIGSSALRDPSPDGKTDTLQIAITPAIKQSLYQRGVHYAQVWYCINGDSLAPNDLNNAYSFRTNLKGKPAAFKDGLRWFDQSLAGVNYVIDGGKENDTTLSDSFVLDTKGAMEDDYDVYVAPSVYNKPMRGCRVSKTPITIDYDLFVTPLEPLSGQGFAGTTNNTSAGGRKLSGANDNDSEVNCTDREKSNCVEVMNSGSRTDGADRRSTYSLDARTSREPESDIPSSGTGSMLGFQLIDPVSPEQSVISYPDNPDQVPIKVTLAPDWDSLRESLVKSTTGQNIEWKKGKYAGVLGLGVGWAFKFRWVKPPATVIIALTVGVSLSLVTEVQFAPDESQEYPCIGDTSCVLINSEPATFEDATVDCNSRGGRLSELSSSAESQVILDQMAQDQVGEMWVGGQLAYKHGASTCALNYKASECDSGSETQMRWLSNSQVFASARGKGEVGIISNNVFGEVGNEMTSLYPGDTGVFVTRFGEASQGIVGQLKTESMSAEKPYACVFEPAGKSQFLRTKLALNIGAAAGFGITGCTPSDNPGLCIGVSVNVISLLLEVGFENLFHLLYRPNDGEAFSLRGNTNFSIPWSIKALEAEALAYIQLYWFQISYSLFSFAGYTLDEGTMFDLNIPFNVRLP